MSLIHLQGKLRKKTNQNKKRTNSSSRWIDRHINDPYVELSQKLGYRSRAAFKLLEINEQYNLIKNNSKILDLGAAPGSWSQVALRLTGKHNTIVAVDLIPMEDLQGVYFIQGDIYDDQIINAVHNIAGTEKFNIIISDIAPNTTGHQATDHLRIMSLAERVFELAKTFLAENGSLIVKIFQGRDEMEFINQLRNSFIQVNRFKPKSSRKESSEIYIIARKYSSYATS